MKAIKTLAIRQASKILYKSIPEQNTLGASILEF